ncbi:hypothetical protein SAMN05421766_1166 [Zobellia uliginosa]|uniref:DUF4142 domain-containing protein n=1 Tax=Zobellia uliginosa TaxID=143224 RepID=A0ABY1L460_9FLAO|nr:hypothetical protein [Zobellia uliginosa]SIT15647.1 hypothetical protein SAMN05421766_1166 [Zobellia uliginosa]
MKKIVILIGLVLIGTTCLAQPVNFVYLPITDMPLVVASGAASAEYGIMKFEENQLTDAVSSYASTYNKRATYYSGILIISMINNNINKSRNRYLKLKLDNSKLDEIKYYSKRPENDKLLAEINENLDILEKELESQHKMVIYGEKLNLLQNSMLTLTRINRKLDFVRKNIHKSEQAKKVIKMIID